MEVIDLISSDEDNETECADIFLTSTGSNSNKRKRDDAEDGVRVVFPRNGSAAAVATTGNPSKSADDDNDDDIIEISNPRDNQLSAASGNGAPASSKIVDGDDEVGIVGSLPVVSRFPHSRNNCLIHPFKNKSKAFRMGNFCEKCYCYVCDVKISECNQWNSHCQAHDDAGRWQAMRRRKQGTSNSSGAGTSLLSASLQNRLNQIISAHSAAPAVSSQMTLEEGAVVTSSSGVLPSGAYARIQTYNPARRIVRLDVSNIRLHIEPIECSEDDVEMTGRSPYLRSTWYSDPTRRAVASTWEASMPSFRRDDRVQVKAGDITFDGTVRKLSFKRGTWFVNVDPFNGNNVDDVYKDCILVRSDHIHRVGSSSQGGGARTRVGLKLPSSLRVGDFVKAIDTTCHVPDRSKKIYFPSDAIGIVKNIHVGTIEDQGLVWTATVEVPCVSTKMKLQMSQIERAVVESTRPPRACGTITPGSHVKILNHRKIKSTPSRQWSVAGAVVLVQDVFYDFEANEFVARIFIPVRTPVFHRDTTCGGDITCSVRELRAVNDVLRAPNACIRGLKYTVTVKRNGRSTSTRKPTMWSKVERGQYVNSHYITGQGIAPPVATLPSSSSAVTSTCDVRLRFRFGIVGGSSNQRGVYHWPKKNMDARKCFVFTSKCATTSAEAFSEVLQNVTCFRDFATMLRSSRPTRYSACEELNRPLRLRSVSVQCSDGERRVDRERLLDRIVRKWVCRKQDTTDNTDSVESLFPWEQFRAREVMHLLMQCDLARRSSSFQPIFATVKIDGLGDRTGGHTEGIATVIFRVRPGIGISTENLSVECKQNQHILFELLFPRDRDGHDKLWSQIDRHDNVNYGFNGCRYFPAYRYSFDESSSALLTSTSCYERMISRHGSDTAAPHALDLVTGAASLDIAFDERIQSDLRRALSTKLKIPGLKTPVIFSSAALSTLAHLLIWAARRSLDNVSALRLNETWVQDSDDESSTDEEDMNVEDDDHSKSHGERTTSRRVDSTPSSSILSSRTDIAYFDESIVDVLFAHVCKALKELLGDVLKTKGWSKLSRCFVNVELCLAAILSDKELRHVFIPLIEGMTSMDGALSNSLRRHLVNRTTNEEKFLADAIVEKAARARTVSNTEAVRTVKDATYFRHVSLLRHEVDNPANGAQAASKSTENESSSSDGGGTNSQDEDSCTYTMVRMIRRLAVKIFGADIARIHFYRLTLSGLVNTSSYSADKTLRAVRQRIEWQVWACARFLAKQSVRGVTSRCLEEPEFPWKWSTPPPPLHAVRGVQLKLHKYLKQNLWCETANMRSEEVDTAVLKAFLWLVWTLLCKFRTEKRAHSLRSDAFSNAVRDPQSFLLVDHVRQDLVRGIEVIVGRDHISSSSVKTAVEWALRLFQSQGDCFCAASSPSRTERESFCISYMPNQSSHRGTFSFDFIYIDAGGMYLRKNLPFHQSSGLGALAYGRLVRECVACGQCFRSEIGRPVYYSRERISKCHMCDHPLVVKFRRCEQHRIRLEERIVSQHAWLALVEKAERVAAKHVRRQLVGDQTTSEKFSGLLRSHLNNGTTIVPAPQPDDMREITMRDYQKQALRFMLSKEHAPNGISGEFWANIRSIDSANHGEIMYSPFLHCFALRTDVEPAEGSSCGGMLCDEMGLGKTISTVALILSNPAPSNWLVPPNQKFPVRTRTRTQSSASNGNTAAPPPGGHFYELVKTRATLVVCAVSLVGQWVKEAKRLCGSGVKIYSYYGQKRKRDPVRLADNDIVVTTYHTIAADVFRVSRRRSAASSSASTSTTTPTSVVTNVSQGAGSFDRSKFDEPDVTFPSKSPCHQLLWHRVVIDEGHIMKNLASKISRSTRALRSRLRWLVTGTPLSTSIKDLYGMLYSLRIYGLHHRAIFDKTIAEPAEMYLLNKRPTRKRGERSASKLFPPALSILLSKLMIRHDKKQLFGNPPRKLLELPPKITKRVMVEWGTDTAAIATKSRYDTLETTNLALVASALSSESKCKRSHMQLYQALERLLCFCSCGYVDDTEETSPSRYSETTFPKIRAAVETLVNIRRREDTSKFLIFSRFTRTLDAFKRVFQSRRIKYATLDGSMTQGKRHKQLMLFENDASTQVFLLSTRAGAVGINLTKANHVFLMEPFWNHALEKQAVGRAWRLGQKRTVKVHRFVMTSSADSRLVIFDSGLVESDSAAAASSSSGTEGGGATNEKDVATKGNGETTTKDESDEAATDDMSTSQAYARWLAVFGKSDVAASAPTAAASASDASTSPNDGPNNREATEAATKTCAHQ